MLVGWSKRNSRIFVDAYDAGGASRQECCGGCHRLAGRNLKNAGVIQLRVAAGPQRMPISMEDFNRVFGARGGVRIFCETGVAKCGADYWNEGVSGHLVGAFESNAPVP